jgi:hypothetical protein
MLAIMLGTTLPLSPWAINAKFCQVLNVEGGPACEKVIHQRRTVKELQ